MRFSVLALDYDGTIAIDGRLDDEVRRAIAEVRARGITVILVTGRTLRDLRQLVGDLRVFDSVVAENGAVLAYPISGRSTLLGQPPPPLFLQELQNRGIQFATGECVVEAEASESTRILAVIREMELPFSIIFNRGRLMVLPQAISKATGLREMLTALRLSAHNAIGIGDAENDHQLLAFCELGVAVGWGSKSLKLAADMVLDGSGPSAVANFIREAATQVRLPPERLGRRRLLLGTGDDGQTVSLAVRGRNVLVSGDPKSGKSWIAGLLAEQLILRQYSVFVIDPEGDYAALESLPGVLVMGGEGVVPRLSELTRVLHHHDVSVVVDLSALPHDEKRRYVASLLRLLVAHRRATGLPHRVLVDEAHYFLHDPEVLELFDFEFGGYTLVTYRASLLRPEILAASEAIIVSRETDPQEVEALFRMQGAGENRAHWESVLNNLALDEAALLPDTEEACGTICKFKIAPRMTSHVRHRHKYFDVPVSREDAFVFTRHGRPSQKSASTLREFVAALSVIPDEVLAGHLRRSDFSRWIDAVFGDHTLAMQIAELENQFRLGQGLYVRDAIVQLIEERYALPDNLPFCKPALGVTAEVADSHAVN